MPRVTLTWLGCYSRKHIRAKFEHALGITQITSEDVRPRVRSQSVLAPSKFLRYPQSSRMIRKVSLKQRSSTGDLRINGNLPRLSLEAVYDSYIKRLKVFAKGDTRKRSQLHTIKKALTLKA